MLLHRFAASEAIPDFRDRTLWSRGGRSFIDRVTRIKSGVTLSTRCGGVVGCGVGAALRGNANKPAKPASDRHRPTAATTTAITTATTTCAIYERYCQRQHRRRRRRWWCSPTDVNNPLLLDHVAVPAQTPHGASDLIRRRVDGPIKSACRQVEAIHI